MKAMAADVVTHLSCLCLAIPIINAFCQCVKALRGVDPACNSLGKETTLAIFGSHCQDIQVLQAQDDVRDAMW